MKRFFVMIAVGAVCWAAVMMTGCTEKAVYRDDGATTAKTASVGAGTDATGTASGESAKPAPSGIKVEPLSEGQAGQRARAGAEGVSPDKASIPAFPNVHFEYDSVTLDTESRALLGRLAAWLQKNPVARLVIEGHCDERGTTEYNLAWVNGGRLNACCTWPAWEWKGTDAYRQYGKERPLDPGHDEAAWARNRRAQLSWMSNSLRS
jgi:peptidoglycan-associated lipoprotein